MRKRNVISCTFLALGFLLHWYYFQPNKQALLKLKVEFNNTINSHQSWLMFNNIPKSGSSTLAKLLRLLASQNNFSFNTGRNLVHLPDLRDRKYVITSLLGEYKRSMEM